MLNRQFFFIIFSVLLTGACATTTPKQTLKYPEPVPPPQLNFTYNQQKASSTGVTANIGILDLNINPEISCEGNDAGFQGVTSKYSQSLNADFLAALMAKGYTITGPFPKRDEITYADKEKAVLMLEPRLHLTADCNSGAGVVVSRGEVGTHQGTDAMGQSVTVHDLVKITKHHGRLTADATIDILLFEPLTGEKMWIKSIKVPVVDPQDYDFYVENKESFYSLGGLTDALLGTTQHVNVGQPTQTVIVSSDGRPSALAHQLQSVYVAELDQFNRYFDAREIAQVIEDARKIRKLKRY